MDKKDASNDVSKDASLTSSSKNSEPKHTQVFVLPPELLKGLLIKNQISKINTPKKTEASRTSQNFITSEGPSKNTSTVNIETNEKEKVESVNLCENQNNQNSTKDDKQKKNIKKSSRKKSIQPKIKKTTLKSIASNNFKNKADIKTESKITKERKQSESKAKLNEIGLNDKHEQSTEEDHIATVISNTENLELDNIFTNESLSQNDITLDTAGKTEDEEIINNQINIQGTEMTVNTLEKIETENISHNYVTMEKSLENKSTVINETNKVVKDESTDLFENQNSQSTTNDTEQNMNNKVNFSGKHSVEKMENLSSEMVPYSQSKNQIDVKASKSKITKLRKQSKSKTELNEVKLNDNHDPTIEEDLNIGNVLRESQQEMHHNFTNESFPQNIIIYDVPSETNVINIGKVQDREISEKNEATITSHNFLANDKPLKSTVISETNKIEMDVSRNLSENQSSQNTNKDDEQPINKVENFNEKRSFEKIKKSSLKRVPLTQSKIQVNVKARKSRITKQRKQSESNTELNKIELGDKNELTTIEDLNFENPEENREKMLNNFTNESIQQNIIIYDISNKMEDENTLNDDHISISKDQSQEKSVTLEKKTEVLKISHKLAMTEKSLNNTSEISSESNEIEEGESTNLFGSSTNQNTTKDDKQRKNIKKPSKKISSKQKITNSSLKSVTSSHFENKVNKKQKKLLENNSKVNDTELHNKYEQNTEQDCIETGIPCVESQELPNKFTDESLSENIITPDISDKNEYEKILNVQISDSSNIRNREMPVNLLKKSYLATSSHSFDVSEKPSKSTNTFNCETNEIEKVKATSLCENQNQYTIKSVEQNKNIKENFNEKHSIEEIRKSPLKSLASNYFKTQVDIKNSKPKIKKQRKQSTNNPEVKEIQFINEHSQTMEKDDDEIENPHKSYEKEDKILINNIFDANKIEDKKIPENNEILDGASNTPQLQNSKLTNLTNTNDKEKLFDVTENFNVISKKDIVNNEDISKDDNFLNKVNSKSSSKIGEFTNTVSTSNDGKLPYKNSESNDNNAIYYKTQILNITNELKNLDEIDNSKNLSIIDDITNDESKEKDYLNNEIIAKVDDVLLKEANSSSPAKIEESVNIVKIYDDVKISPNDKISNFLNESTVLVTEGNQRKNHVNNESITKSDDFSKDVDNILPVTIDESILKINEEKLPTIKEKSNEDNKILQHEKVLNISNVFKDLDAIDSNKCENIISKKITAENTSLNKQQLNDKIVVKDSVLSLEQTIDKNDETLEEDTEIIEEIEFIVEEIMEVEDRVENQNNFIENTIVNTKDHKNNELVKVKNLDLMESVSSDKIHQLNKDILIKKEFRNDDEFTTNPKQRKTLKVYTNKRKLKTQGNDDKNTEKFNINTKNYSESTCNIEGEHSFNLNLDVKDTSINLTLPKEILEFSEMNNFAEIGENNIRCYDEKVLKSYDCEEKINTFAERNKQREQKYYQNSSETFFDKNSQISNYVKEEPIKVTKLLEPLTGLCEINNVEPKLLNVNKNCNIFDISSKYKVSDKAKKSTIFMQTVKSPSTSQEYEIENHQNYDVINDQFKTFKDPNLKEEIRDFNTIKTAENVIEPTGKNKNSERKNYVGKNNINDLHQEGKRFEMNEIVNKCRILRARNRSISILNSVCKKVETPSTRTRSKSLNFNKEHLIIQNINFKVPDDEQYRKKEDKILKDTEKEEVNNYTTSEETSINKNYSEKVFNNSTFEENIESNVEQIKLIQQKYSHKDSEESINNNSQISDCIKDVHLKVTKITDQEKGLDESNNIKEEKVFNEPEVLNIINEQHSTTTFENQTDIITNDESWCEPNDCSQSYQDLSTEEKIGNVNNINAAENSNQLTENNKKSKRKNNHITMKQISDMNKEIISSENIEMVQGTVPEKKRRGRPPKKRIENNATGIVAENTTKYATRIATDFATETTAENKGTVLKQKRRGRSSKKRIDVDTSTEIINENDQSNSMPADNNVTTNATEIGIENSIESATDNVTKIATENTVEKATENTVEKATENTVEKATEKAADIITENTTVDVIKIATEHTVENATEKAADIITENTTGNVTKIATENTVENATEKAADIITENTTGNVTKIATENTVEKATEKVADIITENTTENATENKGTVLKQKRRGRPPRKRIDVDKSIEIINQNDQCISKPADNVVTARATESTTNIATNNVTGIAAENTIKNATENATDIATKTTTENAIENKATVIKQKRRGRPPKKRIDVDTSTDIINENDQSISMPADNNATASATENAIEITTEIATENNIENANEITTENATENNIENATENATEIAIENNIENAKEITTEIATEKATEIATENNIQNAVEIATENSIENATENTTGIATENAVENAVEITTENAVEITTENTVEVTTENDTNIITEKTAVNTLENKGIVLKQKRRGRPPKKSIDIKSDKSINKSEQLFTENVQNISLPDDNNAEADKDASVEEDNFYEPIIPKKRRGRPPKKSTVHKTKEIKLEISDDDSVPLAIRSRKRKRSSMSSIDRESKRRRLSRFSSNKDSDSDKESKERLSDESNSEIDDGEVDDRPLRKRIRHFNLYKGRKKGRPKGGGRRRNDDDYVPHHSQIKKDSKTDTIKIRRPIEPIVKQMVTCGKCDKEMLKSQWSHHNLSVHNDLGWLKGREKPDFDNDEKLVKRVLFNAIKRRKGGLICEICQIVKRSVLGFLSHVTFCGKDEEEQQALMVTCPVCHAVTKPSSLEYHDRLHKMQAEENQRVSLEELENDGPKGKRKAAEKALSKISEFTAQVKEEKDNNLLLDTKLKLKSNPIKKLIKKPQLKKRFPNTTLIKWAKDLESGKDAMCNQPGCEFTSKSLDEIKEHYSMCNFTPQKNYVCKICKFQSLSESEIVKHALQKHSTEDNDDTNLSISDAESSSSGNLSEVDEISRENRRDGLFKKFFLKESTDNSNKMFKFLFKDGACHTKYNKPYFGAFQWTLEFEENNYDFNLFEEYMPNSFKLLNERESITYLPELKESMSMKSAKTGNRDSAESDWKKWKLFEGKCIEDNPTFFVGGPVWALAWLPIPTSLAFSENVQQYIAISTHSTMDVQYSVGKNYTGKNIIQIWKLGNLDHKTNSKQDPELAYAIAHDGGTVWCLDWCPSGCYQHEDMPDFIKENNEPRRMGLLAAACSDGCIRVYSLIFPDDLPSSSINEDIMNNSEINYPIYNAEPVLMLVVNKEMYYNKQQTWQVTKLSWSKENKHSVVVAGFSNGYVALWDLTSKSPMVKSKNGNTVFLNPYRHFLAHYHAITMVHLIPQDNKRFLATASLDRFYKFWDLEDVTYPRNTYKKSFVTDGTWLNHWCCALLAYDEGLSMTHNYAYCLPLREYTYKYYNVLPTNSSSYAISASDYGNSIATGTLAGEVLAMFPQQLLYVRDMDKILPRKRFISMISSTEVVDFQATESNKNADNKNDKEYQYKPSSYSDSKDRFGIKFTDRMNQFRDENTTRKNYKKTLTCEMMQSVPIEQYSFMSANRVAWNPNAWSFLWLAVGYQSGFVRLISFKSLATANEWNKLLESHINNLKCKSTISEETRNDGS